MRAIFVVPRSQTLNAPAGLKRICSSIVDFYISSGGVFSDLSFLNKVTKKHVMNVELSEESPKSAWKPFSIE